MRRFKLALGLSLLAPTSWAAAAVASPPSASHAAPDPDAKIRQALLAVAPTLDIDRIAAAPLPGFRAVFAGGKLLYISTDGHYMLDGRLVDLGARRDLSKKAWAAFRQGRLAAVAPRDYLVYAPAHPKYAVTVFSDVSCSYCRALHRQLADYNRLGIAIRYLPWPREGLLTTAARPTPTAIEMAAVWCAADPRRAFDAAILRDTPPAATASAPRCSDLLRRAYALGRSFGIDGTPSIIGPDGRILGGYLSPEALLQALQR